MYMYTMYVRIILVYICQLCRYYILLAICTYMYNNYSGSCIVIYRELRE